MPITLPTRKSRYNPKELSSRHLEVIRLDMLGVGPVAISEQMGISRHAVRYILACPLAIQKRQELQQRKDDATVDIAAQLAQLCPKSVEVIGDAINGEFADAPTSLRVKTALEVLDRCGYGKIVRTQNTNVNTSLTMEEILAIRQRAHEAAAASGALAQ